MSLFLNREETLLFLRLGVNSMWAFSIWWKISVWISENFLWRMDQHQLQNIRKRGQLCEVYPNSQKLHTGNIRSIWRFSRDFGMIEWFAFWNSTFYGFSGKNSPRIFPYDLSPFRIFRNFSLNTKCPVYLHLWWCNWVRSKCYGKSKYSRIPCCHAVRGYPSFCSSTFT